MNGHRKQLDEEILSLLEQRKFAQVNLLVGLTPPNALDVLALASKQVAFRSSSSGFWFPELEAPLARAACVLCAKEFREYLSSKKGLQSFGYYQMAFFRLQFSSLHHAVWALHPTRVPPDTEWATTKTLPSILEAYQKLTDTHSIWNYQA